MKASIVIPAYNAEKTIGLAVGAALAQDCRDCEVIVVDDGSSDDTAEVAKKYPVKYIRQDNAGPAAARNTGWKASAGEIVVFTDSDCVPGPGWIRSLAGAFTDESIGAATGSYDIANPEKTLPRLIHEEIKDRHVFYRSAVKFFGSYNVAIRRKVLQETGGFDEGYRRASGEDNDLSYRVLKLGYRIAFVPDALVAHHHTSSLKKYLKEQYTHGYWRMRLYRAHPDMAGGDDYTRLKDVVEPPLALLSLGSIIGLPIIPQAFILLTALLFIMQLPAAVRIVLRKKDARLMLLAPVTFLRSYARGLGMLFGFIRFFLLKGQPLWSHRLPKATPDYSRQYEGKLGKDLSKISTYRVIKSLVKENGNVLDIGCGTGYLLDFVGGGTGADISPELIKECGERYPGSRFIVSDCYNIPLPAGRYDTIIMCMIVEHLSEPRRAMSEAKRLLKDGGNLIIVVPRINDLFYRFLVKKDPTHVIEYTVEEVTKLASEFFTVDGARFGSVSTKVPYWMTSFIRPDIILNCIKRASR